MNKLDQSLQNKYNDLRAAISARSSAVVSFSGGVDSALLAKIAHDELKDNAIAVMVNNETVPALEVAAAKELAAKVGIDLQVVNTDPLANHEFTKNTRRRCYLCRQDMARKLQEVAEENKIDTILAGAQASDLDDYRPGIKAFDDAGIWQPLIELGFTKSEVRKLARYLDLPVAAKPAMACLSSRVPYGQEITGETLAMIEAAEGYLQGLGFNQYRARTHHKLIRIEILADEFEKLMEHRAAIVSKMKEIGYQYITLDLEGFRSGSMNEALE